MSNAAEQADELNRELQDVVTSATSAGDHAANVAVMLASDSLTQSEKDECLADLDSARSELNGPKALMDIEAMIGQLQDAVRLYPLEEEEDEG